MGTRGQSLVKLTHALTVIIYSLVVGMHALTASETYKRAERQQEYRRHRATINKMVNIHKVIEPHTLYSRGDNHACIYNGAQLRR